MIFFFTSFKIETAHEQVSSSKTSIKLIASERPSEHHLELQVSGTLNAFALGSIPNTGEGRDKTKHYKPKPKHCVFTPLRNYWAHQTASPQNSQSVLNLLSPDSSVSLFAALSSANPRLMAVFQGTVKLERAVVSRALVTSPPPAGQLGNYLLHSLPASSSPLKYC